MMMCQMLSWRNIVISLIAGFSGDSSRPPILSSSYLLFAEGCDRVVAVIVHREYCV